MSSPLHFQARIEIIGVNPYVLVNAEQAGQLQPEWRKPMPVLVQINGQPPAWHINMMPVGDGTFYLYLHEKVRKASGTKVGDIVTVDVSFDEAYHNGPQHDMPEWFRTPLAANPAAQSGWDALPPSRQKEILRYFVQLKSAEAQQRNLGQVLHVLAGNNGHFMGRDWLNGH